MSVVGHLEDFWRPLLEGSLTIMTVVQDGTSWVRRSVVSVRRWTLGKFLETLVRGVFDHHDGRAGRTVVCMTVRRKCPSLDTCQASLGRVLGLMRRTLRRSVVHTTDRHRGLVLNIRDRTVGTLSNPNEHIWSCSVVDLYVSIPTT